MSADLLQKLLKARGLKTAAEQKAFLRPDYATLGDPMLLPDMTKAVKRLSSALAKKENVVIYGDYDIDGLSATALLFEALAAFGLRVTTFIPSRFDEGYGLSKDAIGRLAGLPAREKPNLIITVDCGTSSADEVAYAKTKKIDVIVTDHHEITSRLPKAVAVINPKRTDHTYPFTDFSGVGVAFGLVRALQSKLPGLEKGHEKWLLDLVALGTICDIVKLTGENRILAYWGLKVLQQTRRPGLKALLAVASVKPSDASARTLGFVLGPRLNASGRLETAQLSLDLLTTKDPAEALHIARTLDLMNGERRKSQDVIFKSALVMAEQYSDDPVLILSHADWNHGINGIVAAKILEKFAKPTFVLQEIGAETKGSARSFGDFHLSAAIEHSRTYLIKGGGHAFAAGVSLETTKITVFRDHINQYYKSLGLKDQKKHLLPKADLSFQNFDGVNEELVNKLALLEPFGHGNPAPVFVFEDLEVVAVRKMGAENQHVKLELKDAQGRTLRMLAFSAPGHFFVQAGVEVTVWATLDINEWQGRRTVEGKLLEVKVL